METKNLDIYDSEPIPWTRLNRFSATGLRQYEQLAVDGRKAVDSIERTVRSLERDPSQVIFGRSETMPEVQGPR